MTTAVRKPAPPRMTVEECLAWEEEAPGRYELIDGHVVEMQAERAAHNIVKLSAALALREAITRARVPCRVWTDGMAVRIDEYTKFEPDAAISCGTTSPDSLLVDSPVIVVEVTSPSTQRLDATIKLTRYFRAPSIQHYLVVAIGQRSAIHHMRRGEEIVSRIVSAGEIAFDPPGIAISLDSLFADLPE